MCEIFGGICGEYMIFHKSISSRFMNFWTFCYVFLYKTLERFKILIPFGTFWTVHIPRDWFGNIGKQITETRMHSSRMRTLCCSSRRGWGVSAQRAFARVGGVCPGGVSAWEGGVYPRRSTQEGCLPKGGLSVYPRGCVWPEGYLPGAVCLGGCLPRGMCA